MTKASNIKVKIYSILGQEVATIINGQKSSGKHILVWDTKDSQGRQLQCGIYTYRLFADNNTILGSKLMAINN